MTQLQALDAIALERGDAALEARQDALALAWLGQARRIGVSRPLCAPAPNFSPVPATGGTT